MVLDMIRWVFTGIGFMTALVAAVVISALWAQARYDRTQRHLSDQYIRLVEEYGFRSEQEAVACMKAVQHSDYFSAVAILSHGREN